MSSEEISLQNGLNVFQDDPLRAFNCGPTARPGPKTGFIDEKMFSFPPSQPPDFRSSNIYAAAAAAAANTDRRDSPHHHHRNWGSSAGGGSTHSGDDESDGDDVDDEEDEDEDADDDDGGDGDENNNHNNNSNNININIHNNKSNGGNETVNNAGSGNPEKMGNGKAKHPFGGSCRELVVKEGGSGVGQGVRESNNTNNYQNAVTIADPDGDIYYTQYLQGEGSGGSGNGQKDIVVENGGGGGCGFSGRKDVSFSSESGESLRAILSDPFTGSLMDDAMILPCGHSYGSAGIQHVLRIKICCTCSQSVSEESVAPNLSLRAAVQAFRREEELHFYRSPKRRRERFDQDKSCFGDSNIMDPPRGRGVQFPFAVTDRVIIKGNKRTPQRFVGREAVVTTQCLNGWYVVKTLDNAESVKLQYRSLAKVPDNPSPKPMSSKMGPNWLST